MSFKIKNDNTSTVKGLRDKVHSLDLDINQTAITRIVQTFPGIRVIEIAKQLELRHIYMGDAAIYSTLDKLTAYGVVAKTVEPVDLGSTKVNKVTWNLTDRFAQICQE